MKNCCGYKLLVVFIGALTLLFLSWIFFGISRKGTNNELESEQNIQKGKVDAKTADLVKNDQEMEEETKIEDDEEEIKLPSNIRLEVPFISQAPYAVWDEVHEETCEEASLLMVMHFLQNEKIISKETAENELLQMVEFQNKNYRDYKDSDMNELNQIAVDYFSLKNGKIVNNPSIDNLKKALAEGGLIIVPAAGRLLGNPNFTPPGPLYHNLVLIGYDNTRKIFITNDPGTRRGQSYEYNYEILLNAIHDFPGKKSDIEKGAKRVLVF